MSPEYSLCPQSTVYVPRVQFMSPEYILCPQSAVYVLRVQFIPRVQFMSSLRVQFMSQEYRVQFMTL